MKDWSHKKAWAAHEAFLADGGDAEDPAGPYYQWYALHELEQHQAAYEAGDTFALLHAVATCAMREVVMPEWLISGFLEKYRHVTHYKVKTLDEAFGKFLPKGAKRTAHRQAREKGLPAYLEVRERHKAGESIDQGLFESVGKDIGVSGSKVSDYYYAWRNARFSK
jgi:hypothetical protein